MKLRSYQQEAVDSVLTNWETVKKTLLVIPCGGGKTIIFCKLTEKLVSKGERVLIMMHRKELIDQTQDKLVKSTGLGCSIEKAEQTALGEWYRITAGSVQTLMSEKRLKKFPRDYYHTIIVDETHRIMANSYQKVLNYFSEAKVLGVTASPKRSDKKDLGEYFETISYECSLPYLIKNKYLVPIKVQTVPLNIDLSGVRTQAGDYKASDIDCALSPYLNQIAIEMKQYCMNRKTIVFLPLIATSQKFRDILNEHGFRSCEVNGKSKDREEILKDFTDGKYNVLCNAMLVTEGVDIPSVDTVILLRPTKSVTLMTQAYGRGTRLSPETGKDHLLILDFLWNATNSVEQMCRPASLIAPNQEVAKKMTEIAEKEAEKEGGGEALDLKAMEISAESEVIKEREDSLAEKLREQRNKKRALVNPLQFAMSINCEELVDYQPSMMWEMAPASDKQLQALERFGIFSDDVQNAGMAAKLFEHLENRKVAGMSTAKQIRILERNHFKKVGQWSFSEANNIISRIAAARWRVPNTINPQTYQPESLKESL